MLAAPGPGRSPQDGRDHRNFARRIAVGKLSCPVELSGPRISNRERMHRQGVEDRRAKTPPVGAPVRRKLSKAELREQAEAAFLAWREGKTAKDK